MNVLISTTTNWNPGDDFIRMGVKNLLNPILKKPNWIHYDRNPDNMVDYPSNQRLRKEVAWDRTDLVVLAGSPEFLHEPLVLIYEGLATRPHIPLWAIGVGYGESEWVVPLTDHEITVLGRPDTVIITRQMELSGRLEAILERKIHTLPCPAILCSNLITYKTSRKSLYISQGIVPDSEYDVAFCTQDDVCCEGFYSSDPVDLLNHISKYDTVVSQRLHGGLAAISCGAHVTFQNDSFRATEALKLFEPIIGQKDSMKISLFKEIVKKEYLQILE